MALLSLDDITIGFRGPTLLDGVDCQIERGQRIGLLGRNGSGKTTLMRMLCGQVDPDHGQIRKAADVRLAFLQQDVPRDLGGSVREVVAGGIPADDLDAELADPAQAWQNSHQVDQILSRMQLDESAAFERLSSGMKRRVLLARALVARPDLLLLDEPTNHLDMDAIRWLEDFLLKWDGTLIFVTHDRMFLRRLATRILEIDRGRLFDWSCDYDTFLQRKQAALEAEEQQQALFDKKLAQEEAWIRQGIKARRTRNEGRVRALEELRRQRSERRDKIGTARLVIQEAQRSGNLVADVDTITFGYSPDAPIVNKFSTTILRGDRIGIVGQNGAGKTTLLRLLLGQLKPHSGTVRTGTNLKIAYFDQLRQQLDEQKTVMENVGDGYETIQMDGRSKHVIGYLQDFLFTPERARSPVRFLSGGERNRVLLAKLFAKPANVIVLDEPTNDLDAETLEMLEERLSAFAGTVLLVSHDRAFLNHVVNATFAFEPGGVREYVGGYDDWQRQVAARARAARQESPRSATPESLPPVASTASPTPELASKPRKLKFKEQQELVALPGTIEQLEGRVETLHQQMAQPEFYKRTSAEIAGVQDELARLEQQLARAFARWEELEQLSK